MRGAKVLGLVIAVGLLLSSADEPLVRIPSVGELELVHKVNPTYPALALRRHIQGVVRFSAIIGKDGHIERLRLIDGHPLLAPAAREAAEQWVYRPQRLRVATQIEIWFNLDSHGT
jgi:TonB family protein